MIGSGAKVAAVVGCVGLFLATSMGPAQAARPERIPLNESTLDVFEDFCGVEGLTVQVTGEITGHAMVVQRGRERLPYYMEVTRFETSHARLDADGNVVRAGAVTGVERVLNKDLKVVDNGDGTLTARVLATGNATYYDSDGAVIARNPGQVRFSLLFDHGGTPTDPSDDTFLANLGIDKESTGRSDDFCAAAVPELLRA